MNSSSVMRGVLVSCVAGLAGVASALPPVLPPVARPAISFGQSKARASFEMTQHDFGVVWDHAAVTVKFPFTNEGEEPLRILDMRSTCGCTVPELEQTEYAPGEGGEITVIFNPRNRTGLNNRTVTITTNDPQRTHRLNVRAEVKPVLDVPRPFLRYRVDKGDSLTETASVFGRGPEFDAKLVGVDNEGVFDVKRTASEVVERDGETWRRIDWEVTSRDDVRVGQSAATLRFETNDVRRKEFTVQAVVNVLGDLQLAPSRASFGRLTIGETFESEIILSSRSAKPFEVKGVQVIGTLHDSMQVEWVPVDPKKRDAYRLVMRGTPKTELRQGGKLVVQTDVEDEASIDVAYYGWVPRERPAGQVPVPPTAPNANPANANPTGASRP